MIFSKDFWGACENLNSIACKHNMLQNFQGWLWFCGVWLCLVLFDILFGFFLNIEVQFTGMHVKGKATNYLKKQSECVNLRFSLNAAKQKNH